MWGGLRSGVELFRTRCFGPVKQPRRGGGGRMLCVCVGGGPSCCLGEAWDDLRRIHLLVAAAAR